MTSIPIVPAVDNYDNDSDDIDEFAEGIEERIASSEKSCFKPSKLHPSLKYVSTFLCINCVN